MMKRTKSEFRTCFVVAPFGLDLDSLESILKSQGLRPSRLDNLRPGSDLLTAAAEAIKKSDLVCAVIPSKHGKDPNLMFELGLAIGVNQDKPVIIILDQDVELPPDLQGSLYVRASLTDLRNQGPRLEQAIRSAVSSHRIRKSARLKKKRIRINIQNAHAHLEEIKNISGTGGIGQLFERFVLDLFKEAGYQASGESDAQDRGADIALWVDDLQSTLGNPILLQTKTGILDQSGIRQELDQLRHYVEVAQSRCGILVYFDLEGRSFIGSPTGWPLTFCLSVEEVIESLSAGSFSTDLLQRRNRAVHGKT